MGTKIAVCITTHNRREVFDECLIYWKKFLPRFDSKIFIVDDGSKVPIPFADFRFETPQGIAVAKNKCLELAEDYDHIFLADDDVWPTISSWHKPYVFSDLNHACFTFNRKVLGVSYLGSFVEYEKPSGLMLYFKKICLEKVGGFDTRFSLYGYEHVNLSDRIFNQGLTPARYIDALGGPYGFRSLDKEGRNPSSVAAHIRSMSLYHNKHLYENEFYSTDFKPYK